MLEFDLLRLMPTVTRAREFRLYTNGGASVGGRRRFVDLWQNGGAAILGHTPPLLLRELKNTASRGLYAPFPHFTEGRYLKALSRLLPGRTFRLYAVPPPELQTLVDKGEAALWRPFVDPAGPFAVAANAPPVLIPVVPGITGWCNGLPLGLCVLAVDAGFESANSLPHGGFLSPVLLAVAARGIHDLIAAAPERANPKFPRVFKALKQDSCQWQRQGIYLRLKKLPSTDEWAALFRRFLDGGFLLPPNPYQANGSQPLILPGLMSPGEESQLAKLL